MPHPKKNCSGLGPGFAVRFHFSARIRVAWMHTAIDPMSGKAVYSSVLVHERFSIYQDPPCTINWDLWSLKVGT